MTPNITVGYLAEQINRGRLDGVAARRWLADEATTLRPRTTGLVPLVMRLGAALARLGARTRGVAQTIGPSAKPIDSANPVAIPAR